MIKLRNGYYYDQVNKKLYRMKEIKPSSQFKAIKYQMAREDGTLKWVTQEELERISENAKNKV